VRFVYAIAFSGKKFVMIRHKMRAWEMPGGTVRDDETLEEAVVREFEEETGMGLECITRKSLDGGTVFFGFAKGWPNKISEEISEVALFDELPDHLSFSRSEYNTLLQEARAVVKSYIKGDSLSGSAPIS